MPTKCPSQTSYKNGKLESWGYEVRPQDDSLQWIKILLELEPRHAHSSKEVKASNELLTKLDMSAHEVVADYLTALWGYVRKHIRRYVDDKDWESSCAKCPVITVPAMWSHVAKDNMLKAA